MKAKLKAREERETTRFGVRAGAASHYQCRKIAFKTVNDGRQKTKCWGGDRLESWGV